MSYEGSRAYRDLKLIEGINLLVNSLDQTKEDKESLKKIQDKWVNLKNRLSFGDQIELIYGTATDKMKCEYMVFCINELNRYLDSEFPFHKRLVRMLLLDVRDSINMAVMGEAHIWKKTQVEAIQAAFRSGRVAKSGPYFEPKELEERKQKQLEDKKEEDYAI